MTMVTKSKARVTSNDIDLIREMYTMIGEIKGTVEGLQEQTAENTRTLRGHNGTPGYLTLFSNLENKVTDLDAKIETVKTSIKDVPAAIDTWKRYPSLTYMIRHNFKEMAIITAAAVTVTIAFGFPDPARSEQLKNLIELLFAKWLRL